MTKEKKRGVGEMRAKNKISVIMDISVFGFYGYIENIGGYFDKNIGSIKIFHILII